VSVQLFLSHQRIPENGSFFLLFVEDRNRALLKKADDKFESALNSNRRFGTFRGRKVTPVSLSLPPKTLKLH